MDIVLIVKDEMVVLVLKIYVLFEKNFISINDLDNELLILCRGGFEFFIIDMFNKVKVKLRVEFMVFYINILLKMI